MGETAEFFPGLMRRRIAISGAEINVVTGGSGQGSGSDVLAVCHQGRS